jgi:tyrosyl-tRNA synthetase
VDNLEWLGGLKLIGFLRDIGKHFTVGWMLQKESVRARLETGISFTEFSYMLLQAYDFLELHRRYGCALQLGGSDQWGNITAGIELIRRLDGAEAHGLTAPLIATASGAKFGKTEGGAVWLDGAMTSPYQFYQFWLNADDRDVEAYLKTFSLRPREEIAALVARHAAAPGERVPHRALADELTERVHGTDAARRAVQASRIVFGELEPRVADAETWRALARELPSAPLSDGLGAGSPVVDLVVASGVVPSRSAARRQIAQGGIAVNGEKVTDAAAPAPAPLAGGYYFVSRGRKTHAVMTPRAP